MSQPTPRADALRAMREAKYQRMQEANKNRRVVLPSQDRVREIADRAEQRPTRAQVEASMQASAERAKQRGKEKALQSKQRKTQRLKRRKV